MDAQPNAQKNNALVYLLLIPAHGQLHRTPVHVQVLILHISALSGRLYQEPQKLLDYSATKRGPSTVSTTEKISQTSAQPNKESSSHADPDTESDVDKKKVGTMKLILIHRIAMVKTQPDHLYHVYVGASGSGQARSIFDVACLLYVYVVVLK